MTLCRMINHFIWQFTVECVVVYFVVLQLLSWLNPIRVELGAGARAESEPNFAFFRRSQIANFKKILGAGV